MEKFLQMIDFIQNDIGLYFNKRLYYKSNSGGIFTILTLILVIITVLSFGREIYSKENAKTSTSKEYMEFNYINLTQRFPIAVSLVKRGAFKIDDHRKVFNISFVEFRTSISEESSGTAKITKNYYQSGNCTENDLIGMSDIFMKSLNPNDLSYFTCLKQNQNIELYGTLGSKNNSYIALLIEQCVNGTEIVCKTKEEIKSLMDVIFISIWTSDFYFDTNDYKTPAKKYVKNQIIPLSASVYKRQYLSYKLVDFITDIGIIFNENEYISQFQLDISNQELFFTSSAKFNPSTVAEISFTLSKIKDSYFRNYYKIQNLAADVGGIIKFILIIFNFLNSFLNNYLITNYIFQQSFPNFNIEKDNNQEIIEVNNNNPFSDIKKRTVHNFINLNQKNYNNINKDLNNITDIKKISIGYKNIVCFCYNPRKTKEKILYADKTIKESLCISKLVKSINKINLFENVIFNDDQRNIINYLSKYKIFGNSDNRNINIDHSLINLKNSFNNELNLRLLNMVDE